MSYTQKVIIRNLCGMRYFWGKIICSDVKSFWPLTAVWEQWPCAWVLPREEVSLWWCMFAESEGEEGCGQCVVCVAPLCIVFREGASGKLLVFLKDQAMRVFGFVLWMVGRYKYYFTKCLVWILWDVCIFIYVFFNFKFVRFLLRFSGVRQWIWCYIKQKGKCLYTLGF